MEYIRKLNERNLLIAMQLYEMIIKNPKFGEDEKQKKYFDELLNDIINTSAFRLLMELVRSQLSRRLRVLENIVNNNNNGKE